ncbi:hypothetical protein [Reinekea sp. G2M2-21]|uniref:hypothetical protein n=1 Tax=Reinekea sp. G2M2-21 TaxID=2788942 RepID=UPI0018AAEDF6|nr:hypothetical protein [Reinekea sp. G2M2-21]
MDSNTYRKVLTLFSLQYPLYWLVLALSAAYFSDFYVWLLNAEIFGGNGGPTSILVVQGTLNFSLVLDLTGAVFLITLLLHRRLYPKAFYFRLAGFFAFLFWLLSVSKYLLWLV